MNTPRATLGDVPLSNYAPIEWSLSVGCEPNQSLFVVDESEGDALLAKMAQQMNKPISLVIAPDGLPQLKVDYLFIVGEAPRPQPYLRAFYVMDRRYLWKRRAIYRHFNVLRRTGNRRLVGGVPTQIAQAIDSFTYADWSINNGKRWNADAALRSVADEVCDDYRIDGKVPDVPIQGLEIDDPGDGALLRMLAHVGGWDVVMGYDGQAVIFDANALNSVAALLQRNPPIDGSGVPSKSNLRPIRPSKITVLFNREVEVRFDSVTEDESPTLDVDSSFMENVLPIPDDQLTITVGGKSRVVTRGTHVPLRYVLAAWNTNLPTGAMPLTFNLIRLLWLQENCLEAIYCGQGQLSPTANWVMRIAALREHYRKTFQITNKWMRRIKGLRPKRLGVYDPITGIFAPSGAYMDYAIKPSAHGISNNPSDVYIWLNVHGYPGLSGNVDGPNSKQAPCIVEVLDEDLGIVHLAFRGDTYGLFERIVPSLIVDEHGNENSVQVNTALWKNRPIAMDAKVYGTNTFVQLSAGFHVAMVLTALPAAPNSNLQFHDIRIMPSDIPKVGTDGSGEGGDGRQWATRVGPGILTARIGWVDAQSHLYRRLFGVDAQQSGLDASEIPAGLVLNDDQLKATAKAVAASLWSKMLDHYDGSLTTTWDPDAAVLPKGNVSVVRHVLDTSGVLTTTITASPVLAGRDILQLLPDSFRTAVFRILPPGGV